MRETEVQINEQGTMRVVLDAQMSKMSPEQRVAMASLNHEAKKLVADRLKWDAKEKDMEEIKILKVETPFKEAYGEDIDVPEEKAKTTKPDPAYVPDAAEEKCLPDPLAPQQCEPTETVDANPGLTHSLRYSQETLAVEFERIFKEELMALRNAGQKEYAHDVTSPFANFERGAKDMGIDRKQVLWVYAMKHKDGIAAAIKGHTSQREDVRGRINDLMVYLLLLRGMYNEEAGNTGNFGLGKLGE